MRLVLPTLWSPSKTILVRLSVPVETSVEGDVAVAMSGCCKQEGEVLVSVSVSFEGGVNKVGTGTRNRPPGDLAELRKELAV